MATTAPPVVVTPSPTPPLTPSSQSTTQQTPTGSTDTKSVKPGWKTTEFWLALVAKLLGALFAAGMLGDGSEVSRVAGLAAIVLTSLGYSVSRAQVKAAATLALVFFFARYSAACTQVKAEGQTVLDCAHLNSAQSAISEFGPLAASVAFNAVNGDGTVAKDQLISAFGQLATDAGKCVALDAVAKLSKLPATKPGAPASSAVLANAASVNDALAALKTQLAPGREVRLE